MALRCQLRGIKCPPYKHEGIFQPDDEAVKSLLPDLTYCAACIANATPQRPDLHDDLLQVAALTLIDKGPKFDPEHESSASFRSFIRVRICGALMDEKKREERHNVCEVLVSDEACDDHGMSNVVRDPKSGSFLAFPDPHAEFEAELVQNISFASALPELLKTLTPREREVFAYLRENKQNREIGGILSLSAPRVSQLVTQVTQKLRKAGQRLGLAG
ncbi:MAG: sigma-70 family RNA polymerase sigma factor [Candidatus Poribacteria bacterium]|nr:sigma-70 family RNA polymerase sigma factor [Candidatus Poribacteria bacterium]